MTTSERGRVGPFGSGPFAPGYGNRVAALLLSTAFTLSTAYLGCLMSLGWMPGAPAAVIWTSQLTGFATAALVLVDRTWVWWVSTVSVAALMGAGIWMYAVLFVPGLETAIGWFVNDVHLGLLALALGLCVHRLRGR